MEDTIMTSKEFSRLISKHTQETLGNNFEYIMKSIMSCIDEEEGQEDIYSLLPEILIMISKITTELSVATTISVFNALGKFNLEDLKEIQIEKPFIHYM